MTLIVMVKQLMISFSAMFCLSFQDVIENYPVLRLELSHSSANARADFENSQLNRAESIT